MKTLIRNTALLMFLAAGVTSLCHAQEASPEAEEVKTEKNVQKKIEFKNDEGKGFSISINSDEDNLEMEIERAIEDELESLTEEKIGNFMSGGHDNDSHWGSAVLIPIFAIIFVFGMPIFIVGLVIWGKHKRRKLMHETIGKMVEKGVEIPPHLLKEEEIESSPTSALRRGVILAGVGLGLMGFFGLDGDMDGVGIGCIPFFIGLAYLVVWKLEGQHDKTDK